jgi:hypothetical protein
VEAAPVEWHQAGERLGQLGEVAQQPTALSHRLDVPLQVGRLQVADAAVEDAQVVPARVLPEVVPLEQQRPETLPRGLERERHAVHAAADDDQVVGLRARAPGVPLDHAPQRLRQSWNTIRAHST